MNKEKKKIKVDISDIKFLIGGIILLLIPIIFLIFMSSSSNSGGSVYQARNRLGAHKKAFSFTRRKSTLGEKPKGTSSKTGGNLSSIESKISKAERQWEAVVKNIKNAKPYIPPSVKSLPKNQRQFYEAQMNKDMRFASMLMETGDLVGAKKICLDILKSEPDNMVLRFMASGKLCDIYEAEGNILALKKEFARYIDLMSNLKIKGFKANNLKMAMMSFNKMAIKGSQLANYGKVKNHMSKTIQKYDMGGKISEKQLTDETVDFFRLFPATNR